MLLTHPSAMRKSTIDMKRDRPGDEVDQRLGASLEAIGVLNNMSMPDGENVAKIVALLTERAGAIPELKLLLGTGRFTSRDVHRYRFDIGVKSRPMHKIIASMRKEGRDVS